MYLTPSWNYRDAAYSGRFTERITVLKKVT